jgi:hypothetical protein
VLLGLRICIPARTPMMMLLSASVSPPIVRLEARSNVTYDTPTLLPAKTLGMFPSATMTTLGWDPFQLARLSTGVRVLGWNVLPRIVIGAEPVAPMRGGPQRSNTEPVTSTPPAPLVLTSMPGMSIPPRPMTSTLRSTNLPVQLAAERMREPLLLVMRARAPGAPTTSRLVLPLSMRSAVRFMMVPVVAGGSITVIGTGWLSTVPLALGARRMIS